MSLTINFQKITYWLMFGLCLWTLVSGVYTKAALFDAFKNEVRDSKACFDSGKAPLVMCYSNPTNKFLILNLTNSSGLFCYA